MRKELYIQLTYVSKFTGKAKTIEMDDLQNANRSFNEFLEQGRACSIYVNGKKYRCTGNIK